MSFLEFDAIQQYFSKITDISNNAAIPLAIGDDAAIVSLTDNKGLVVCTDTLNVGVHFPLETSAYNIGYKALAVNLSDLAAMGAMPSWFTLNVSLPELDEQWVNDFSQGLAELSRQYNLSLIGGDTTRGPLSITITLAGHIDKDKALKRSNAMQGDNVYLSGCTGEAAFGLSCVKNKIENKSAEYFINRLNKPTARVALGQALVGIANACIDISDGLLADAKHISTQSGCEVQMNLADIPLPNIKDKNQAEQLSLSGGDDYELLFTVPKDHEAQLEKIINSFKDNVTITCIGKITKGNGVKLFDRDNNVIQVDSFGYEHFSE